MGSAKMRQARFEDHWRHVNTRPYNRYIQAFNYSNINGLGNGEIKFRGGISAICGGNGVGKSTLLEAIAGTIISPNFAKKYIDHGRLQQATLTSSLIIDQNPVTRSLTFSENGHQVDGEFTCEIIHINPATLALRVISFLSGTANFSEVLDSLESKVATATEIDHISYILGKNYESIETYEIEDYSLAENEVEDHPSDAGESTETFPYFRVVSNGMAYTSETMGLGELSLFILVWTLNRLSENSILLIEEPETYISPSSQKKFMNFLARISDIKHVWVILTTHSPSIVDHIPLDKTTLLSRGDQGVIVIDTPTKFQLDQVLDKSHSYSGILVVEDEVAKVFLSSLLSKIAPDIHQRFEILIATDGGKLTNLIKCFPKGSSWLEIFAVYDGDQRNKNIEDNTIKYGFLPNNSAPELVLQNTVIHNLESLSQAINRQIEDVRVVLGAIEGVELHDWLEEFCKRLNIEKEKVIDLLVLICLDTDEKIRTESEELIDKIRKAF
jgi:predicted ATPase